ncbi:hypothetical protein EIP91_002259 [Steccherinum ochraceum]|uniref:F-box domain-containing protein n=1 Tax=Steccherinum ochraceum TaxID=92696 RepID=A0A4R0RCF6_9APHY|nr:hypothetical protein EIP91_002259 [Steccherinum ochraceum]
MSPINDRLPAEMLSAIFVHCVHDAVASWHAPDMLSLPESLSWMTCTHVCRYWREIALHTPELWTFIWVAFNSTSVDVARCFISLSQQLPLSVFIYHAPRHAERGRLVLLHTVLNELPRIQDLTMLGRLPRKIHANLALRYRNVPAPLLRRIHATAPSIWQPLDSGVPEHAIAQDRMPRLQSIRWVPFGTRLNSLSLLFLPSLTSIVLENALWHEEDALGALLRVLDATPLLQFLQVSFGFPSTTGPDLSAPDVRLDHLRKLTVTTQADSATVVWFFQHITMPVTAHITCRMVSAEVPTRHPQLLITHLDETLRRPDYDAYDPSICWPFTALCYDPMHVPRTYMLWAPEADMTPYITTAAALEAVKGYQDDWGAAIVLSWRSETKIICPALESAFVLPTTGIRALFWGGQSMRGEDGTSSVEHMQQVETLVVDANRGSWHWSSADQLHNANTHIPFPNLKTLVVLHCAVSTDTVAGRMWWRELQRALNARLSAGLPRVETIVFAAAPADYILPRKPFEWMRELCEELIVDPPLEALCALLQEKCPQGFARILDWHFAHRERLYFLFHHMVQDEGGVVAESTIPIKAHHV